MPYFKSANILFIHIPKTGGTSVEKYFAMKFSMRLGADSLFMFLPKEVNISNEFDRSITLQHQPCRTILKFKNALGVDINDKTKIMTIVRNPYHRLVSGLIHNKLIRRTSNQKEVYNAINIFIGRKYDNHSLPQHQFVINNKGSLIKDLIILRTEQLTDDMKKLGYDDFKSRELIGPISSSDYMQYLNADSIELINKFYDKDFSFFNYNKIIPSKKP